MRKDGNTMKAEYIQSIENLLQKCDDVALLDLIYQLLAKTEPHQ